MATLPGGAGDDRFTGEEPALRRVATLVARGAVPEEVFAAVTEEAGRLLHADYAIMARYDPDGARTIVGRWDSTGAAVPAGTWAEFGGRNMVFRTGQPARIDEQAGLLDRFPDAVHELGLRAVVGVPVSVEGRLWGLMVVASRSGPLPAGTETQLARFTELAATAIANAQARMELRGFADEQAALRRVATLVARAAPREEVFAAVTEEAGRLLHADHATMAQYRPDATARVAATWGGDAVVRVGATAKVGEQGLHTMIFHTGRPARVDDPAQLSEPVAEVVREFGLRAAVGVPVSVGGQLWGVLAVESRAALPAGTEARLAGFTELAATAIANAEAQDALTASRARIVATADATRRRIERNLHDGAQQHLVTLALQLRAAQAAPPGRGELEPWLEGVADGLAGVLEELREIAHGLHPAVLAQGGLRPALKALADRAAVLVRLDIPVEGRLPEQVEIAAYYAVAEALANIAKHAQATVVDVQAAVCDGNLQVRVHDNGRGGADFGAGTGLVGLKDRAEALGGHVRLNSPRGTGTTLELVLPLQDRESRRCRPKPAPGGRSTTPEPPGELPPGSGASS
jgi:signal transduction histidine kinase